MSDLASTETVDTTTAESAPATESPASSATGGDSAPSGDSIRSAQIEALKSARERGGPADDEDKPEPEAKTGLVKDPATGKFVSAKTGEPEAQKSATEQKLPEPEKQQSQEPPAHLAPDIKALWSKLPPDTQEVIAARTLEDRKALSRLGNTVKQYEPFNDVYQQHKDYFDQHKAHPAQVFDNLMAWNGAVANDPVSQGPRLLATYASELSPSEKQVLLANTARELGITIQSQQGADNFDLPPDPATVALQARFDALERQNANLVQRLSTHERSVGQLTAAQQAQIEARAEQARAAEDQQMSATIASVQATALASVDPAHHDIFHKMAAAELTKMDPNLPDEKALKQAYEIAQKKLDAFVQPRLTAAEKSRQESSTKAAAAAKRAGSINVEGAVDIAPANLSVRETQRAALARARASH